MAGAVGKNAGRKRPGDRLPIREIVDLFWMACPHWSFRRSWGGGHLAPLTGPELVARRIIAATRDDVVEVQVLLTRPEDFVGMNAAYAEFFGVDPPARSVAKLGVDLPGVLVSIRMTAFTA